MSKAERTRQLIVEKTAPIFNTKGFAGTSISDMTEATGLTKGSIYGNFANKDEVALAAFDHNLQKLSGAIGAEVAKQDTARAKLLVYVKVYDSFLKYPFPIGGCPILNTTTEADDTHPPLKSKVNDAIVGWKDRLVGIIEKGIENKEFKKGINAEQIALTLIALIEGAILITKATGKLNYRKAVMSSAEKMIMEL
ncbi:MAG TPA: TetR/AcrR family transcriptional regulator [Puia sp.]|jgi:AcrR family transcriptional regulator